MDLIGRRFGHIRVDRMLGQGGMGLVYEGVDVKLDRRVALKILQHPKQHLDAEARTRLTREARTLSRLDHPNICRIYDFIDTDDADILVLELIDGRTLEEAMKEGLTRSEKLRIALSIAEVLVVAHRAGIIHRDLKPENVMLTKSGEVKVLDFGLARWLERTASLRTRAAQLHTVDAKTDDRWFAIDAETTVIVDAVQEEAAPKATAAGITVGTPIYMSPEQARGEPVTTASDMYSFGLLLHAVFTGKDPYPDGLTAREVMLRAARGESLPVTGVEHNIAAVIKSLKAFAPADRPTARDALRRIRYVVDTPKRYARRIALAAALALVAFAGWKYVTDLRRERTAAQLAEAEAKHRRAQADSLIEFMLGDLRTKLEPVGRLDVLDDVAARSLRYMSSLDPKTLTAEELARTSKALNQLGEVRMSQGNLAAAIPVFDRSLALAREASAREPKNPELELGVGTAHFWLGNAFLTKGDLPAALTQMKEYRSVGEALASRYPNNDAYQLERAYGHSDVGKVLEKRGDLDAAGAEYRTVQAVKELRVAEMPADLERRGDLALTMNNIGLVQERLGNISEARASYEREFSILTALAAADPKNARWQDRLANSHSYLAALLENIGDVNGAIEHRAAALTLYQELSRRDPTNADWQRNVAITLQRHALLLRSVGRADESLREVVAAEGEMSILVGRDPNRRSWQRDRGLIEATYSMALLSAGRPAAARGKALESIRLLTTTDGAVATNLANAYLSLGDAEQALGHAAAARQAWSTSATLVAKPAAGRDPRPGAVYAQALTKLGLVADARDVIARVHRAGYRHSDFERVCGSTPHD